MEYPMTRRVTWVNDETGEMEGQCEYVREDVFVDVCVSLDKILEAIDSCIDLTPELLRECESTLTRARGLK